MCGIIGYLGKNNALPILIDGLKRLEYRGYDSSGFAIQHNNKITAIKAIGKIKELENKLINKTIKGRVGVAHTRWATHGKPSEANAHPHTDCKGDIWLVHNGIIENYQVLKKQLEARGHIFKSETDTEVIAHLIEDLYNGNLVKTLQKVLKLLKGAYGLVVFHAREPDKIIAARYGSPLLIGLGDDEIIVASDVSAIIRWTKQVIYLDDMEIAEINGNGFKIFNSELQEINKIAQKIKWGAEQAEKQGFPYFMLKEIFEQPEAVINSTRGRFIDSDGKAKFGGLENIVNKIHQIKKLIIVSCGTSFYAGLIAKNIFEEYAEMPVQVDYASEFRYRKTILDNKTAIIALSQSGETADTLAAVKEAKERGALTLGIVNVVGSSIARETDAGVYNHIGPEISVASTKSFTSQLAIMALLTVFFGRQKNMSLVMGKRIIDELQALPDKIQKILKLNNEIKNIANKYYKINNFAYLGRKYNLPVSLEGALKLKEISYIHAEGFPAGEMKHGSIALIDKNFPSVFIAPRDSVYEKNLNNMEEIKSRGGRIIAVATQGDNQIKTVADDVIYIPKTLEMLTPILSVIPLQLFAYHMAVLNGRDADKPRNLAKSVTVE
ncbi:MAG: glutamine--fructose-6-phosphate transaminase (isomerizing) [Patescibacteria group bacterium]|nr:glutamine--fructose-6-phosphate transaminase (isomerizing) [Patescibacteria group bacterium]